MCPNSALNRLPAKQILRSGSQTTIESSVSPPGVAISSKRWPPSVSAWRSSKVIVGTGRDWAAAPPAAPEAPGAIMAIDPDAPENGDDVEVIERVIIGEDGKEKRVRMVFRGAADHAMQGHEKSAGNAAREGEHAAMMHTLEKSLAEADRTLAEMPRILEEALAAAEAARGAGQQRVIVKHECRPGSDEVSEAVTAKDGSQIVTICQSRVFASARRGLAEARDEIAQDKDIPEDTRKQILKELDRTIARWADKEG